MKTKNNTARVALPGSQKEAPKGAKAVGKIDPEERIEVTIRLRRRAGSGEPKIGSAPLSREEFRSEYGADPADQEKIEEFANDHELDVVQSSIAQRSVRLSGSVAAMQAAFGTRLKSYQAGKRRFRGRMGTLSIPKHLAPIIEGVLAWITAPMSAHSFILSRKQRVSGPAPRLARGQ